MEPALRRFELFGPGRNTLPADRRAAARPALERRRSRHWHPTGKRIRRAGGIPYGLETPRARSRFGRAALNQDRLATFEHSVALRPNRPTLWRLFGRFLGPRINADAFRLLDRFS